MTFARSAASRIATIALLSLALCAATLTDAAAQSRRNAPTSPGRITVENQRNVALVELKVVAKGEPPTERIVAKSLAAGKKVVFTLPPRSGCIFDVVGTFSDDTTMESEERNLCQDKVLRLVE